MSPLEEGLKVTIEEMRCIETSAYLPVSMFSSYQVDTTQEVKFKISLKVFTECLSVFGDDNFACLKLSYKEHGSPLYLM